MTAFGCFPDATAAAAAATLWLGSKQRTQTSFATNTHMLTHTDTHTHTPKAHTHTRHTHIQQVTHSSLMTSKVPLVGWLPWREKSIMWWRWSKFMALVSCEVPDFAINCCYDTLRRHWLGFERMKCTALEILIRRCIKLKIASQS